MFEPREGSLHKGSKMNYFWFGYFIPLEKFQPAVQDGAIRFVMVNPFRAINGAKIS